MENNKNRDSDIRYEVLVKILVRMPIYSVFRFKCVSKHWNSIISHPSFAEIYVSRATNTSKFKSRFLLLFDVHIPNERKEIIDFSPPTADLVLRKFIRDEFPLMVEQKRRYLPFPTGALIHMPPTSVEQYNVIGASNGFLLLCTDDLYYVYSLVTREIVAIPPPSNSTASAYYVGFIMQMEGPLVERFRIVQARKQGHDLVFRVYSSEIATWTEQRFRIGHLGLLDARIQFAFKGHLHWVDCRAGILAYDPFNQNEQCRLLKFPNSRSVNGLDVCVNVSKEHIRLVETPRLVAEFAEAVWICSVWRLEDYDKEEWYLEHRITHDWSPVGVTLSMNLIPLLCDPVDPEKVYLCHMLGGQVISFNLQTEEICIDRDWLFDYYDFLINMIHPIEIPIWPSPIPRPHHFK